MTKISIVLTVDDENVTDLMYDLNTLLEEHETVEMREVDDVRYELDEAA